MLGSFEILMVIDVQSQLFSVQVCWGPGRSSSISASIRKRI